MTRFIFFPSSPSPSLGGTSNGDVEVYLFPLEPAHILGWHEQRR